MHSQLAMNMLSDYKIESCIGWFLGVRFRFSYLQSHRSRLTFGSLTVWFLGPLPRQYLRLTPNITKRVMNRIANVIKRIFQFFISSSFFRLFTPILYFLIKSFGRLSQSTKKRLTSLLRHCVTQAWPWHWLAWQCQERCWAQIKGLIERNYFVDDP